MKVKASAAALAASTSAKSVPKTFNDISDNVSAVPMANLPRDTGSSTAQGPRLKDYLEYYRAKKAGVDVATPFLPTVTAPNVSSAGVPNSFAMQLGNMPGAGQLSAADLAASHMIDRQHFSPNPMPMMAQQAGLPSNPYMAQFQPIAAVMAPGAANQLQQVQPMPNVSNAMPPHPTMAYHQAAPQKDHLMPMPTFQQQIPAAANAPISTMSMTSQASHNAGLLNARPNAPGNQMVNVPQSAYQQNITSMGQQQIAYRDAGSHYGSHSYSQAGSNFQPSPQPGPQQLAQNISGGMQNMSPNVPVSLQAAGSQHPQAQLRPVVVANSSVSAYQPQQFSQAQQQHIQTSTVATSPGPGMGTYQPQQYSQAQQQIHSTTSHSPGSSLGSYQPQQYTQAPQQIQPSTVSISPGPGLGTYQPQQYSQAQLQQQIQPSTTSHSPGSNLGSYQPQQYSQTPQQIQPSTVATSPGPGLGTYQPQQYSQAQQQQIHSSTAPISSSAGLGSTVTSFGQPTVHVASNAYGPAAAATATAHYGFAAQAAQMLDKLVTAYGNVPQTQAGPQIIAQNPPSQGSNFPAAQTNYTTFSPNSSTGGTTAAMHQPQQPNIYAAGGGNYYVQPVPQQQQAPQPAARPGPASQSSNVQLLSALDQIVDANLPPPIMPSTPAKAKAVDEKGKKPAVAALAADAPLSAQTDSITAKDKYQTGPNLVPEIDRSTHPAYDYVPKPVAAAAAIPKAQMIRSGSPPRADPFNDPNVLNHFVDDVEKFAHVVENLNKASLSGPTLLEKKWKELAEFQEIESRKHSISVARCCYDRNLLPDVMPYDDTRVVLKSAKNDYINASYIKKLNAWSPAFIATQMPLSNTVSDFWLMIFEQQIEIVVAIVNENEMKSGRYWPNDRSENLQFGKFAVHLQSEKEKESYQERILTVTNLDTKQVRSIIQMQFVGWPVGSTPENPRCFLRFLVDVLSYFKQQRSLQKPICVHCTDGAGRTGVFCLLCSCIAEIHSNGTLSNVIELTNSLRQCRKNSIYQQQQLLFAHEALLYHAQELLMKRGILTNRSTFGSAKVHSRHPSQDFMQNPNLQTLHSIDILGGAANSEQRRGSVHRAAESDQTVQNRSTRVGPKADGLVKETACADFVSKFEATDVGISRVKTADFDKPKIEAAGVEIAKVDEGNANEIHGSDAINGSKPQSVDDVNSGAVEQNRTLTDLIDPKKFDIGPQPGKKKMTKEDFLKPQSKKDLAVDSNDPFALLDPLRSMK